MPTNGLPNWNTPQAAPAPIQGATPGPKTYSLDDAYAQPAVAPAQAPPAQPLTWDHAQALNAQPTQGVQPSAPLAAPTQAPPPATYSLDDAYAPPPAAQPTHPTETPTGNTIDDFGNFLRTAAVKAGAGVLGLMGNAQGADPMGPLATPVDGAAPPSASQLEDMAFNSPALGPEYQPQTTTGRLAMGAATGALSTIAAPGGADSIPAALANAVRGGAAGAGAEGASELGVSPWLGGVAAPLLELLARTGYGVAAVAAPAVADAARTVFHPNSAGEVNAGRALANVDNSGAALPSPSASDIAAAQGDVQNATGAITSQAAPPFQAGQQIRTDLTGQQDALTAARTAATAPIAAARDASMASIDLDPVTGVIAQKLRTAAGAQATALNGALADLKMPSGEYRANADQMPAARQSISARITAAKQAGDNATAANLLDVRNALDAQVNAAVPEAGQYNSAYAAASRPLDVFRPGQSVDAVPNVVARDNFGNLNGTPPSEIPDTFLRGSGVKEKLDQLVTAYGGDQGAAEGALTQHLAHVASSAIDPATGQLNPAAFARAMAPYQKALDGNGGVWFPRLKQNFANAQSAQQTLDTLTAQKGVSDSITNGGLRDNTGNITAQSFNGWLAQNADAVAKAQGLGAVMRLQSLGQALKSAGGNSGNFVEEAIPAAVGMLTGGVEGGILGGMLHNVSGAVASPWTTRVAGAFNSAIENSVRDPAYARQLVSNLPRGTLSAAGMLRAVAKTIGRAPSAAPRTIATTGALSRSNYRTQ